MTYHVVCHDCELEGLVDTERDAHISTQIHKHHYGHEIEYMEV